ncbi:hypothetical protein GTP44_26805 [Duganella sp. FT50W]|uniref:Uncharacterized protein n=1 Tax=Duganella lactea TaxID=2692173 RepID=A0A6L8MU41_9BURK|nr:hypothetical protein [Duganella lactea]MYM85519.1 hypothetical protein [Duganella lactea]
MVYTSITQLTEDGKFKKRVSEPLAAIGDHHDLIVMARDYVAGLWDAQLEYRIALADFAFNTESAYTEGVYLYADADVRGALPNVVALAAVGRATDGSIKERTPIVYDLIAQRKHYEQKNDETSRRQFG